MKIDEEINSIIEDLKKGVDNIIETVKPEKFFDKKTYDKLIKAGLEDVPKEMYNQYNRFTKELIKKKKELEKLVEKHLNKIKNKWKIEWN